MSDLETLTSKAVTEIASCNALTLLEQLKIQYLGKNSIITGQLKALSEMTGEERKTFGALVNTAKQTIGGALATKKLQLEADVVASQLKKDTIDITLPSRYERRGCIHPISQAIEEIVTILGSMGFTAAEGPNIEDDFHNFTALNIPENHPARQMHDTFYLAASEGKNNILLRTHTSPVQIRTMKASKPPFRIISAGRVYRCDSDMTHAPMFHQIEGLLIDKAIHLGHLKGCITQFLRVFFEKDAIPVRFRPHFFPFTEPSAEVDIGYRRQNGEFKIGEGADWLEILGCGMVHPNVLKQVNIDPEEYQGFAFGAGIERLAMLKYGISDLRSFFEPDIRWLQHYGFASLDIPTLIRGLGR